MTLRRYLALGDSMSIDYYPALDLAVTTGPRATTALEDGRWNGAASLLYRNNDQLWPEFSGRDLRTLRPEIAFDNLHDMQAPAGHPTDNYTTDGATTADVISRQLCHVENTAAETLVTLTAGGNDMLQMLATPGTAGPIVERMRARLSTILAGIRGKLPNATILVGTVYDPTDGTNVLDGRRMDVQARWLADYNAAVREIVREAPGARLADIHAHFLGHGTSVPETERWYWSGLIFEPNARGASEIRRVWLRAVGL